MFTRSSLTCRRYVKGLESRISQMENELKRHQSDVGVRTSSDNLQILTDDSHLHTSSHHQDAPLAHPIPEGAVSEPTDRDQGRPPISTAMPAQESSPDMMSQIGEENHDSSVELLLLDGDETYPHNAMTPSEVTAIDITHLGEPILDVLIDLFYRSIYQIFPIVHPMTFRTQYHCWIAARRANNQQAEDNDFSCLLYSLLAVAASMLPKDHIIFEQKDFEAYRRIDLAGLLYSHASSLSGTRHCSRNSKFPTNVVISQGLLSVYLTETGNVKDAWVTAGHAIRLYQSLDLDEYDNSPTGENTRSEHKQLWWCLYILDRSLSTALLKPLAIDDADSDMESCSGEEDLNPTHSRTDPWFSVIADFHVTMGRIYRSVRWIRKSQPCKNAKSKDKLRSHVKKHDAELERYYRTQVLPRIEEPNNQIGPLALQTIAISSYYIGVVLLYRTFIERHNISEPETFLRCAEAASNCIKVTPQVMATVPASHFVIQQSRAIYASTKVLLHCMRLAQNPSFTNKAWPDVESGFNTLRDIKIQWPEIRKYQTMTEQDMKFTQSELNKHALFYQAFSGFGQTAHSPAIAGSPILQIEPVRNSHSLGSPGDRGSQRNGFRKSISRPETESSTERNGNRDELQRNPKRRKLTPESFFPCDPTAIIEMLPDIEDPQDCEATDLPLDGFPGLSQSFLDDELGEDAFDDSLLLNSIEQFMSYPSD